MKIMKCYNFSKWMENDIDGTNIKTESHINFLKTIFHENILLNFMLRTSDKNKQD
jgi:hypothetical protein